MPKAVRIHWDDPANTFYSDIPRHQTVPGERSPDTL